MATRKQPSKDGKPVGTSSRSNKTSAGNKTRPAESESSARKPSARKAELATVVEKAAAAGKGAAKPAPPPPSKTWTLRLYIAGDSPKSRTALANLKRLCEAQHLTQFEIEVVDLKKRPELAKADQILAVPTLIRKVPEPMKRIIGDLSNADRALVALELVGSEA